MTSAQEWTRPYCGLTHLGEVGDRRRASVQAYETGAELCKWDRSCGFSPETKWFASVEAAKKAGESWVTKNR